MNVTTTYMFLFLKKKFLMPFSFGSLKEVNNFVKDSTPMLIAKKNKTLNFLKVYLEYRHILSIGKRTHLKGKAK